MPFILCEEEIKGKDGDMFAAYSVLSVGMAPGNRSGMVMWEASGSRAQLGAGGRARSECHRSRVTNEAGKVYLCLATGFATEL